MAQREKTFGPAGLKRRAELMEAAVVLAARQGFSRTRVSDIVGHVGVGQGVFYWYFESKDALFREIMSDTTRRLRLYQGGVIGDEPDPVRRIAKGILASLEFVVWNRYVFALLDHAAQQSRWRQQRTEADRVHTLDTVRHLEEAMRTGAVRDGDAESMAHGISGVVDRMARRFLARPSTFAGGFDGMVQQAIDFCLSGISGPCSIPVEDLRAEVGMPSGLAELRDRVGAGGVVYDAS